MRQEDFLGESVRFDGRLLDPCDKWSARGVSGESMEFVVGFSGSPGTASVSVIVCHGFEVFLGRGPGRGPPTVSRGSERVCT